MNPLQLQGRTSNWADQDVGFRVSGPECHHYMPALLIISGIFLVVLGWIWVAVAARHLPIGRLLLAVLAAPVTLIMRGRGYARLPRLAMIVGLLLFLGGIALLQEDQPERFRQLLNGEWAEPLRASSGVEGTLLGQPFTAERVFWRGSELVFEEGAPQRVRRALVIRLGGAPALLQSPSVERLPGDPGAWPELLLQWHTGALGEPGLLRVTDDYTLSLAFIPQPGESVLVRLRLHLPTRPATLVSGETILEVTPAWLADLARSEITSAPAVAAPSPPELANEQPTENQSQAASRWQDVSVLALLDEPVLFAGQQLRLTTQAGRHYEGRLKGISDDRRIVLAQSSGANQMDFHFQPADVAALQVRYRSSQ